MPFQLINVAIADFSAAVPFADNSNSRDLANAFKRSRVIIFSGRDLRSPSISFVA